MLILVATKETQGQRKNDYSWVEEGELIGFSSECDGEAVDGQCGCRRAMSGLKSLKATTTFKVVDLDMTTQEVFSQHEDSLKRGGWADHIDRAKLLKMISMDMKELASLACFFGEGAIVEKRGKKFQQRLTVLEGG